MAIQNIGTSISGIASDTKPTLTANEKGVIFVETDTNKIFQWDTDSWNQIVGAGDVGSGAITTTGLISGGSLDIDDVLINGTTIGHTNDTDLITVADGLVTIAGEVSTTTLDIGGTNVTSTAAELNILDGVTSTAAELNLLDGVSGLVQADLTKLAAIDSTAAEVDTLDALDRGSIIYGNASGATTVLGQGGAATVLTSDGTDIAWAAAGGGGGTIELTVASGNTIEPGMAVGLNAAGEAIPFVQDSGDYTGMTPYKPDATKSIRYMQVDYDTETDIHIAVYMKSTHANVLDNALYAAPFTVDADDNITFGTEITIHSEECIYGKYSLAFCSTRKQFVVVYLRGNGAAAPQGIRGYLLKPIAGSPNTLTKSTYFDVISSTSIGSYLPDVWDSSSGADHRMVTAYIGASYYVKAKVIDLDTGNNGWNESNGTAHNVTLGSEHNFFNSASYHEVSGDWTRSIKSSGSSPTGGKQHVILGGYAFGFDIGVSGTTTINNSDVNTRYPSSGTQNDTVYAGTAGEVHSYYKNSNAGYIVRTYIGTTNTVNVDSTYSHYDSNAVLGSHPNGFRLIWTNTTDKFVAIEHRNYNSSYVVDLPGTTEHNYRGIGYKQYGLNGSNVYTSDESVLSSGQVKVNYLQGSGRYTETNRDLGVCYNPDRSRIIVASGHTSHTSDRLMGNAGVTYTAPGSGIWMIKVQSGELNDERGTFPPFIGFGSDDGNITAGNTVTVTITGGINEQLTGLSVGADYFLDSFGKLNPYYPLPVSDVNILAGKAIAANKLLVHGMPAPASHYFNK